MTVRGRAGLRIAALVCIVGAGAVGVTARPPSAGSADTGTGRPAAALRTPLWSARRVPALLTVPAAAVARDLARVALTRELDSVVAPLDGCAAVDDARGALARAGTDRALAPASTLKLLTATAALARFGPDHRFVTRVVAGRGGDLVVVGGGDPLLATPAYVAAVHRLPQSRDAPYTALDTLAARIVASGIRRVAGALVVDDHFHGGPRFLAAWKPVYAQEGDIGALGALAVDGGFADPVGRIPAADPALDTGNRLTAMLATRGVTIEDGVRHGDAPAGAREVARVESPRLADVVGEMLSSSDNFTAETLVRDLAATEKTPATTERGLAIVERELDALHVPSAGLVMYDGSGLAPADRVSCATMLHLIALAETERFRAVDDGLAVAARRGTLAARFAGTPLAGRLRAKTGSISGVVGLVGVVDGPSGLRFAFLANGNFSTATGERLQTEVATAVGSLPDLRVPADLVPAP